MAMVEPITSRKWKELLDEVRTQVEGAKVTNFGRWRRLACRTPSGRKAVLALGTYHVDDDKWLFPFTKVHCKLPGTARLRLGEGGPVFFGAKKWKAVSGLESQFEEKYKPISTDGDIARRVLTKKVRTIVQELESIPPGGITVLVEPADVTTYKLKPMQRASDLGHFFAMSRELAAAIDRSC